MFGRVSAWGVAYFVVVFCAGFVLGILRVGLLEARLGTRWAELLEMPLMFVAIIVSANWIVRTTRNRFTKTGYIAIGSIALGLLLAAEASLVLWLRGISIQEYIAGRDPISGSVYVLMLLVFGAMPAIITIMLNRNTVTDD